MRVLLLTGKGGAGTTTLAAATAVHAARLGLSTLVLSTDPGSSLGDVLGRDLPSGEPHEVEPRLLAERVDPAGYAGRAWPAIRRSLSGALAGLDLDPAEAGVLAALPGAADLAALLTLRDRVRASGTDLLVVDAGSSARALSLLALPELVGRLVDRALPTHRRVLHRVGLGPARGRAAGDDAPLSDGPGALLRLRNDLADVREVLHAPGTSVRLVLTPQAVAMAECRRTWSVLVLHGHVVDAVIVNRFVPNGVDPWRASCAAAQTRLVPEVRAAFAPVPLLTAPYLDEEPIGTPWLAALGAGVLGRVQREALTADPPARTPMRVERDGDDFELVLDLGIPAGEAPELARLDDDLLVGLPGWRGAVPLPSVLRRCAVASARVRAGAVRVRFVRNPHLWPVS